MTVPGFSPTEIETLLTAAADEAGLDIGLCRKVLVLRRRFARDGNRRRLFAAFDDLLSGGEIPGESFAEGGPSWSGPVRLRRLTLRNWKVFESLDLELPTFSSERPVVLIGGKNGYGKTSILEGLVYGLFGPEAVVDLTRTETPRQGAYRQLLERAYNRRALARREGVVIVRSEWETPEGLLTVERRWYFDDDGAHVPDDEVLTLWVGEERAVLGCPEGMSALEFYQSEVHRRLLTPNLAAFIFFDGERVQRFAEAEFGVQVRAAVENAFGLSPWRGAAVDLRDFARDRLRGSGRSEAAEALAQAERLAPEQLRLESTLAALMDRRRAPEARRDSLLAEIGRLESGNFADLHQLLERRQANAADQARARHEFAATATQVLPAFLAAPLRAQVCQSLETDAGASFTDSQLFESDDALEALLAALPGTGPLDRKRLADLEGRVRTAWAAVRAQPTHIDQPPRHAYLPRRLRRETLAALRARPDIQPLQVSVERLAALAAESGELADAIEAMRQRDERLGMARRELQGLREELAALEAEQQVFEARLADVRSEASRLAALVEGTVEEGESGRRAKAALSAADAFEQLVADVLPPCFDAFGTAVTDAYRALAHKDLVAQVQITADGAVLLLDGEGRDVRAFDVSAGESQVFAMALMGAIGATLGNRLPVVIDTPLGRLDPDHRRRILEYFTTRDRQTFLLSQPDEVRGPYLAMIEPRIAARFRLDHGGAEDGGPGGSTAAIGYFPELAA